MLKLLTIALPRLLTRAALNRQVKSVDVYSAFVDMWFEREMWKQLILYSGIAPTENRIARYFSIAQLLSQHMFERGVTSVQTAQLHLPYNEQQLLSGLPLLQQPGNISFIHKSVQEYFIAYGWMASLSSKNLAQSRFGARLASSETGILRFVSQLYNYTQHHETLMELVLASNGAEEQQLICIAAANAITVLNSTQFSFSGMDLSGINIQGAILDNAMLHKTNLSHTNLTEVSLRQAWLESANLSCATLSRASFGQQADIILSESCCCLVSRREGFVAVTVHGHIHEDTGRITRIRTITAPVLCVVTHNDILYAGTIAGTVVAWDLLLDEDAVFRRHINTCSGRVLCIALSTKYIITGCADYSICIWDRTNGAFVNKLQHHTQKVSAVVVHGGKIFSGSADNTIRVWDLATLQQVSKIEHLGGVQCLAIYEGMIISGSNRCIVHVWDASTYAPLADLSAHTAEITCVTFFEGKIISGSADSTVLVWDLATCKVVDVLAVHAPVTSLLVWSGKVLVACDNKRVQVWDFAAKPRLHQDEIINVQSDRVNVTAMVDNKMIIAGEKQTVQIVDVHTQDKVEISLMHSHGIRCLVPCDGSVISWGGELRKWNPTTLENTTLVATPGIDIEFLEVSKDKIIAGGWAGLFVIDAVCSSKFAITEKAVLAMGADAKKGQVVYSTARNMEFVDVTTREHLGELDVGKGFTYIKCHEGKLLIAIAFRPEVEVWDMTSRTHCATLRGHKGEVLRLAVFGERVASNDKHTVLVWDLNTYQCLASVTVLEEITSISLSHEWLVAVCVGELKTQLVMWWRMEGGQFYLGGIYPRRWPLNMRDCNVKQVTGRCQIF
jgi:WD40 repeat protein